MSAASLPWSGTAYANTYRSSQCSICTDGRPHDCRIGSCSAFTPSITANGFSKSSQAKCCTLLRLKISRAHRRYLRPSVPYWNCSVKSACVRHYRRRANSWKALTACAPTCCTSCSSVAAASRLSGYAFNSDASFHYRGSRSSIQQSCPPAAIEHGCRVLRTVCWCSGHELDLSRHSTANDRARIAFAFVACGFRLSAGKQPRS